MRVCEGKSIRRKRAEVVEGVFPRISAQGYIKFSKIKFKVKHKRYIDYIMVLIKNNFHK